MGGIGSLARAVYRDWTALKATRGRILPQGPAIPGSHSHNDYEQRRPLRTALRHGFVSVEADVWPVDGELLVGHEESDLKPERTLRRLYLAPLASIVAEQSRVQPGWDKPFQLLIDIKLHPEAAYRLLDAQLHEYSTMLTRYSGETVTLGAVSVVVTGEYPRKALSDQDRLVAFDGRINRGFTQAPATVMPMHSDHWKRHFRWRGWGKMPATERRKLRDIVARAHAADGQVRFWGTPCWPAWARRAVWGELMDAGVDQIGADHPADFRRWYGRTSVYRPA